MSEDQAVWFELQGHGGFRWGFIADFDTYEDAEQYDNDNNFDYGWTRIVKVQGIL